MKKSILFLAFLVNGLSLIKAQVEDFEFYNQKVDSLIQVYSVNIFVSNNDIRTDLRLFSKKYEYLTVEEKYRLINKAEKLFDQRKYFILYNFSAMLLDSWKTFFVEPEIRSYITEILLDKCFYYQKVGIEAFFYYEELTPHSIDRVKIILQGIRTAEEMENLYWYYGVIRVGLSTITLKTEGIMKKTGRKGKDIELFLKDSLIREETEKNVQAALSDLPIYPKQMYALGNLGDTTFIPIIKQLIEKYPQKYTYTGTYALAKLGDKESLKDILTNYENVNYCYLRTEEAMWRYLEQNYIWTEAVSERIYGQRLRKQAPKAIETIFDLSNFVKNVPKEVKIRQIEYEDYFYSFGNNFDFQNYDPEKDEKNQKNYQKFKNFYQWLIDNKGKIEFIEP